MHEQNGVRHVKKMKKRNLSNTRAVYRKDTDERKLGKLRKKEAIQVSKSIDYEAGNTI